jgi:hypothetical protein
LGVTSDDRFDSLKVDLLSGSWFTLGSDGGITSRRLHGRLRGRL